MTMTIPAAKEVVVLLHGIRTRAAWAEMVARIVKENLGYDVQPIRYGYFDLLRFLSPFFTRATPVDRIKENLRDLRDKHPDRAIHVIAHSFGTYAIAKALEDPTIRLGRVIFCGSIVPEDFRKARFRGQLSDCDVLNDCGTHDIWPIVARTATWGFGSTGTFGFGTVGVRDRFNKFGHSDYFDEAFVRQYWIPFLCNGEVVPTEWESKRRSPVWLSLLDRFPLKWLGLAGVATLVAWMTVIAPYLLSSPSIEVTQLWVSHWMGVPTVTVNVHFDNPTFDTVQFSRVEAALVSPEGQEIPLELEGFLMPAGLMPPLLQVRVQPRQHDIEFPYSFIGDATAALSLKDVVVSELARTRPALVAPDPDKKVFSQALTLSLQEQAKRSFIWRSGKWKLKLSYGVGTDTRSAAYAFEIKESHVNRLKSRIDSYASGLGVLKPWRWIAPDGSFAAIESAVTKSQE